MALTTTTTTATASQALEGDDAPKWRVEHSISDKAVCNQAACKRSGVKIAKGELRLGTLSWFEHEGEQKVYRQWRHWGCVTKHQIEGLVTLSGGNPDDVPGYAHLSSESQEQVRLALDEGNVVDKEFKDIRPDLARFVGGFRGEIRNAVGYKVEVAGRGTAGCRNTVCKDQGIKIAKGELRLGIATMWDGEHVAWVYKHWKCISQLDLTSAKGFYEEDSLHGIDALLEEYRAAVLETFATGEVVVPPKLEFGPTKKTKKPRALRKNKVDAEGDGVPVDDDVAQEAYEAAEPKRNTHKKRTVNDVDIADEFYEPATKKRRGQAPKQVGARKEDTLATEELDAPAAREKRVEAVDRKIAGIQALVEKYRAEGLK